MSGIFSGSTIKYAFSKAICIPTVLIMFQAASPAIGLFSSSCLAADQSFKSVIELYTSQGCSSCPPADALLGQLAKRSDIIALTLPVNYWDHLGWKDTLAVEANNERQRSYAETRGDHEIYTPQMIVNGVAHVVGSRLDDIEAALSRTNEELHSAQVPLSLEYQGDAIVLQVGAAPAESGQRSGTLWVACFTNTVNVDIKDGENDGRKLTYTNVVRTLINAGHWDGNQADYNMPVPQNPGIDGCAAFLQGDKSKNIFGSALSQIATH